MKDFFIPALKNIQKNLKIRKLKVSELKPPIIQMKIVHLFLVRINLLVWFLDAGRISMKRMDKLKQNMHNPFVKKKKVLCTDIKIRNALILKKFQ